MPRLGRLCNSSHVPSWVGHHLPAGFWAALLHPAMKCGRLGSTKRRFPGEEGLSSRLPKRRAEGAAPMQCLSFRECKAKSICKHSICRERRQEKPRQSWALRRSPARTKETPRVTALPNCSEFRTSLPHSPLRPPQGWGHRASLATPLVSADTHPNPLLETAIVCRIYCEWSQMPR